jgi:hypothetical protein
MGNGRREWRKSDLPIPASLTAGKKKKNKGKKCERRGEEGTNPLGE